MYLELLIVVVQLPSHVQLFATPLAAACQASLSLTIAGSLPKFMSIESVTPSNHLILYHPLLFLPSIFPSISAFSNESVIPIRWPKYWSFSISSSSENSGLISFRIDWFISLQSKGLSRVFSSITVQKHQFFHAFFMVQLSHSYMTTGKIIALSRQTFVGKVMSLHFNMLSRFITALLLISWLQSPSTVILEPK